MLAKICILVKIQLFGEKYAFGGPGPPPRGPGPAPEEAPDGGGPGPLRFRGGRESIGKQSKILKDGSVATHC